ncbi:uncharacterized protein phf11 [Halichoeres trimaculatus]|uniref:uncharacterized protein phf11 n=1 Tax=Halichoeres trimaculatus TaxID=147232 RepID=UPI003D9F4CEB
MKRHHEVFCVLCQRSEETKVTGALSSKENVTAHQNCLLFSSGIYCEDSPQEDDLFGFSVDAVRDEVKRGQKLKCSKCNGKGATSGCEFGLCKKSYHYPCAVEDKAHSFEHTREGRYGIYCSKHQGLQNNPVRRRTFTTKKSAAPRNPSEAGALKSNCLTCENKEGDVPLDSLSNRGNMSYCDKHAPSSHKDTTRECSGAGPSVRSSDANSSNSTVSKRRKSSDDDCVFLLCHSEEVCPVRKKSIRRSNNPFQSADEVITNTGSVLFAPIEDDDIFEVPPDFSPVRNNTDSPAGSGLNHGSGNQPECKDGDGDEDSDDDESQSLLAPVHCITSFTPTDSITELHSQTESTPEESDESKEKESNPEQSPTNSPDPQTAEPSALLHSSTAPSPQASKPDSVSGSHPCPSSAQAPPEPCSTSLLSPTVFPEASANTESAIDSASFWKNCNVAGCTQAIFSDFMKEMNELSEKIQSKQASQTDYDQALKVMSSSGQLEKLVAKQQKELQRKQRELEKAAAAMAEAARALLR